MRIVLSQDFEGALIKIQGREESNLPERCFANMLGYGVTVAAGSILEPCCNVSYPTLSSQGNLEELPFKEAWDGPVRRASLEGDPRDLCKTCPPTDERINLWVQFVVDAARSDPAFLPWADRIVQQAQVLAGFEDDFRSEKKRRRTGDGGRLAVSSADTGAVLEDLAGMGIFHGAENPGRFPIVTTNFRQLIKVGKLTEGDTDFLPDFFREAAFYDHPVGHVVWYLDGLTSRPGEVTPEFQYAVGVLKQLQKRLRKLGGDLAVSLLHTDHRALLDYAEKEGLGMQIADHGLYMTLVLPQTVPVGFSVSSRQSVWLYGSPGNQSDPFKSPDFEKVAFAAAALNLYGQAIADDPAAVLHAQIASKIAGFAGISREEVQSYFKTAVTLESVTRPFLQRSTPFAWLRNFTENEILRWGAADRSALVSA